MTTPITPAMVQAAEPVLKETLKSAGYRAATVATLRAGLDAMAVSLSAGTYEDCLADIRDVIGQAKGLCAVGIGGLGDEVESAERLLGYLEARLGDR